MLPEGGPFFEQRMRGGAKICLRTVPGRPLRGSELLDRVWGYDATPVTRTVDVHVASLRQKLEENPARPELIVTIHGLGYKFLG